MKTLWITYAWKDNLEGDFDYLTQELQNEGLKCIYDKIALVPGKRLWEQIAERIESPDLSAWAYLLTKQSIESEPCKEELSYALARVLSARDKSFPIIGLIHNLSFDSVPLPIRTRLCVNLRDVNWKTQVIAGVNSIPPIIQIDSIAKFHIVIHKVENNFAIEIRPRFEDLRYWRIAIPSEKIVIGFGVGASGYFNIGPVTTSGVEGTVTVKSINCKFVGCGDIINSSTSAFVLVQGEIPGFVAFGLAKQPFGVPDEWYPIRIEKK